MESIKRKISDHKAAIILALCVSALVAFPQLYFRFEHRSDGIYQGIELLPDSPWSARVREIQDGHGFGSIYYKDGKSDPYLHLPLGSMVVAYMGKLFALDINNTLLLSRIVLSFIAFILIYAFVFLLSRDKRASLASASVILLADALLDYSGVPRLISDALAGTSPSSFLELTRPVYSAMIFVPLFAFLACFWQFYSRRSWKWGLASAIFLGLEFYNYFYTWTYLYAFGAILILILLLQKNWQEAKRIGAVFLGALLVAIPYFVNLYRAVNHPLYEELSARHGIVSSLSPLFIGSMALLSLVIFLLWFPKENREKYFFSLALLLAPVVTLNQQVITGMTLQTGHYHWYFHKPIAVIFILITIFYLLAKLGFLALKRILALTIISVSFASGLFIQVASYWNDLEGRDGGYSAIERQKYGPVMKWLSLNAPKDSVVLANKEASHLVVIYTPLNVFHHRSAQLFFSATEERLLDAVFTYYRLRGVGREDAREVLTKESHLISPDVYGIYYRDNFGSYAIHPDKLEEIIARYEKTLETPASKWLENTFRRYQVEHIVWDKLEEPSWNLNRLGFLGKAAEFGNMAIYKFNQ